MMALSFSLCKCSTSLGSPCFSTHANFTQWGVWSKDAERVCVSLLYLGETGAGNFVII